MPKGYPEPARQPGEGPHAAFDFRLSSRTRPDASGRREGSAFRFSLFAFRFSLFAFRFSLFAFACVGRDLGSRRFFAPLSKAAPPTPSRTLPDTLARSCHPERRIPERGSARGICFSCLGRAGVHPLPIWLAGPWLLLQLLGTACCLTSFGSLATKHGSRPLLLPQHLQNFVSCPPQVPVEKMLPLQK